MKTVEIRRDFLTIFFLCVTLSAGSLCALDEKEWRQEKSTHFIVYYKEAQDSFLREVIARAEEYYGSIAESLGFTRYDFWLWDKRARIYIYKDSQDYQLATGKPQWSGGSASCQDKVIETYPWAQGFLDSLLPHELGHIIFREFIGPQGKSPLWLDEGVAMYQERLKRQDLKAVLIQAVTDQRVIPLSELSRINITSLEDKEKVSLYYAQALSVVEYLINSFGRDDFVELCKELKAGAPFEQALKEAYRVFKDLGDLDKGWFKYLKEVYAEEILSNADSRGLPV